MSKTHTEIISCPQCSKKSGLVIWDSINTSINPEMKGIVHTLDAFQWKCSKCGYTTDVEYVSLYHQAEDHIMIYCVPDDEQLMDAYEALLQFKNSLDKDLADQYKFRIVDSIYNLQEKLLIFSNGLDDRAVEIMKGLIAIQLNDDESLPPVMDFLFASNDNNSPIFKIRRENEDWDAITFNKSEYRSIERKYKTVINAVDEDDLIINAGWALEILKKEYDLLE